MCGSRAGVHACVHECVVCSVVCDRWPRCVRALRVQVKSRLAMHAQKRAREAEMDTRVAPDVVYAEYERKTRQRAEEEEARKAAKKERQRDAKKAAAAEAEAPQPGDGTAAAAVDEDLMAAMGFGGFGSSKKS